MNTTRNLKLSAAVALGLSLMGASLAADAASAAPGTKARQLQSGPAGYGPGKVIHLGTITVTGDDTETARYAMAQADQSGTMYLGSVRVTPRDAKAPVIGGMLAVTHYLAPKTLLTVISTLVIDRVGG